MLFGEHAVIYDFPCLVTAVDLRIQVSVERIDSPTIQIDTPHLRDLQKDSSLTLDELFTHNLDEAHTNFIIASIRNVFSKHQLHQGLRIKTTGPVNSFGLGSSSAVTVATIYALTKLFGIELDKRSLFDLALSTVLDVQKVGSGFDVASAIFGGTLFFQPGQRMDPLQIKKLPLVIGFSGAKVSTTDLVRQVDGLHHQFPEIIDLIFATIGQIASTARVAIDQNDWQTAGLLANINQGLLDGLGVSSDSLDRPIRAARQAGALGAKLSGAGGGDCMFAIVDEGSRMAVENAIQAAGAQVLHLGTNAEGVRLETGID